VKKLKISRRRFGAAALGGGAALAGCEAPATFQDPPPEGPLTDDGEPATQRLVAPASAEVLTTACDYCIVGCGYKAYVWPLSDEESGEACEGIPGTSRALSENAQNTVTRDGRRHRVVVVPDPEARVVNVGGDYGGGGALARKLYNPETGTRDRLQRPKLRVGEQLVDISWDDALDIAAGVIAHAKQEHGDLAFGMKTFSYNYYENTYAVTKLMFDERAMHSPCWAPHDQPASASSAPGLSDAGVNAFSASYGDWSEAEVIMVSGVSLVEARPVLFQSWIKGRGELIVVNPRRDATAAYAVANGGMHLQIQPGTDTLLYNAMARVILENGWEDGEFVAAQVADAGDLEAEPEGKWRRRRFARSLEGLRAELADGVYALDNAAAVCGVDAEDIVEAARRLTMSTGGRRRRASFMLEKGNYWGFNYENSASYVTLGLLCGAGNRPGQVISRGGGHQRGMLKAAGYPSSKIPDSLPRFEGNKRPLNLDMWAAEGNLRAMWVMGTTWFGATAGSRWLRERIASMTVRHEVQLGDDQATAGGYLNVRAAVERLRQRMDAGGTVLLQSDVYPNAVTELADIVFPASGWGEHDFTRMQGERRLRLYSRIADAPGEARADWEAIAGVAKRLGFPGFDWENTNEIFEEAAEVSRGRGVHDYGDLVVAARARGMTGHELLREMGTTGIQCPVRTDDQGELAGTVRMHEDGFGTASGKAALVFGDWRAVEPRRAARAPREGALWLTNMRTNAWQSLYDDRRDGLRKDREADAILQLHPADAEARGVKSGDEVRLWRDDTPTCTGERTSAEVFAVAHVTEDVPAGVMCGYFNFRGETAKAINALGFGDDDPVNALYSFKISSANVEGTGRRSPHAARMSFVPRSIFGRGS
jgi:arsenite oxidase large subunit